MEKFNFGEYSRDTADFPVINVTGLPYFEFIRSKVKVTRSSARVSFVA